MSKKMALPLARRLSEAVAALANGSERRRKHGGSVSISGTVQSGILLGPPAVSRHLEFVVAPGAARSAVVGALAAVAADVDGEGVVLGVGASAAAAVGATIPGLRTLPAMTGAGVDVPSTPRALWLWLRGNDRGVLVHRTRALRDKAAPALQLESVVDCFDFRRGRDLTGYEDGTENPTDDAAIAAAIADGGDGAPAGSSFAAVQQWQHDLATFASLGRHEQDFTIGRDLESNEELDDAPESAHVKRTAQESFDPPAFILRRSMPWSDDRREGLVFLAFGATLDPYETLLRRMLGLDDGVVDALFRFARPIAGAYYWCPPLRAGHVDLGALGI